MSPRAYVVVRKTQSGKSYHVRFKRAGGSTPIHWGAYPSRKLAERARDYVNGEFAVGRYPDPQVLLEPAQRMTVLNAVDAWVESHPQPSRSVVAQHRKARAKVTGTRLARADVTRATFMDVQEWVNDLVGDLAPATVRKYLSVVRGAFAHVGRHPNPATDPRVKLPQRQVDVPEPPSYWTVQRLAAAITPRHCWTLNFLERTGLRTVELAGLTWRDVDLNGRRLRVRVTKGGTGGVRWVPLPGDLAPLLAVSCPHEDRAHDRRVFQGFNANTFRGALARASRDIGSTLYSPHDLRHRYISLLLLAGIDPVLVAKVAGHRKRSTSIDVYGHVLLDEPDWRLDELRMGVSWVSGLTPRTHDEHETPARAATDNEVGSTGIELGSDQEPGQ